MFDSEFEVFYKESYAGVLRIVRRYVSDMAEAEDITQDAFSRCYPKWTEIRHCDSPMAWVAAVASNLACSRLRRMRVAARIGPRIDGAVALAASSQAETRVDLVRALRRVPPRQRVILVMHYVGDISIKDIAVQTETTESSVKTNLHRGRIRLAKELGVDL